MNCTLIKYLVSKPVQPYSAIKYHVLFSIFVLTEDSITSKAVEMTEAQQFKSGKF
jgi:hypothetical protein